MTVLISAFKTQVTESIAGQNDFHVKIVHFWNMLDKYQALLKYTVYM